MITLQQPLVLGSSSPFRRELLQRFGLPFECDSPNIDESPLEHETSKALAERLAIAKAKAVAKRHNKAIIISSDQVAECNGRIFGKPGNHANAVEQLQFLSGQTLHFQTSLCVLNSVNQHQQLAVVPYSVRFRQLSIDDIEAYLLADQPYDCAGSFKSEALGICLFEKMQGDDPTSLIGLPLITLTSFLKNLGFRLC